MKVGASILHYMDYEVTCRCVDSLLRLRVPSEVEFYIVVVDNCSPNNSYSSLMSRYSSVTNLTILRSPKNGGFAQGNNIGYEFLNAACNCDIGLFLNNDTEIQNIDFLVDLINIYTKNPFDVLSIDVYDPHADQHQSPLCLGEDLLIYAHNEKQSNARYLNISIAQRVFIATKQVISQALYSFSFFRKLAKNRIKNYSKSSNWEAPLENVVPQGACVIFGKRYFQTFSEAFKPLTVMYFEECILKILCDQNELSVRYTPSLQILHHHHELSRKYLRKGSASALSNKAHLMIASYNQLEQLIKRG